MKSIQDIINHYKKEDKPMITNENYNPEKLAYFSEENARQRYENEKRRKLTDMAIRNQREPWERVTPDEVDALLQGDMDTETDEPHHHLEGIVDISEGEE
jgi:hypothetical protein